jgi:hypothetical protein
VKNRWVTSSISLSHDLHKQLKRTLPRWGDRSRLVARLLEMWLGGEIIVPPGTCALRSLSQQPTAAKGNENRI